MSELAYLLSGSVTEKVRWHRELDAYGDPVYGGRRTIAHLEWTNEQAIKEFGVGIVVLQGGFNTDVELSKGTHDYDGWIDCFIPGVDWWTQQRFFRRCGWAAFYRYPPAFGSHIHMGSLGCPGRMGIYCPGQFADYLADPPRNGLKGHAQDPTWHPADIRATYFNYPAWVRDQEDNMPLNKEDLEKVRAIVRDEISKAPETIRLDVGEKAKWSFGAVLGTIFKTVRGK